MVANLRDKLADLPNGADSSGRELVEPRIDFKKKELDDLVASIPSDEDAVLLFQGGAFYLYYDPENSGKPAEWHTPLIAQGILDSGLGLFQQQTQLNFESEAHLADIYIWSSLPRKFKPYFVAHCVLNAYLAFEKQMNDEDAHRHATTIIKEYARETLPKDDFKNFENLSAKLKERFDEQ